MHVPILEPPTPEGRFFSKATQVGLWQWPAVREGFEHVAENVIGDQPLRLRTLSLRPVVFSVEKFLTDEDTDKIIAAANNQGMRASEGVLQTKEIAQDKKHNEFRTSVQAWLEPRGKDTRALVDVLDGRVAWAQHTKYKYN